MIARMTDLVFRSASESDYPNVAAALATWWDGGAGTTDSSQRVAMLPRLFFQHFADTSTVVCNGDEFVAFLVGFLSQTHRDEAYIHFVGVSPDWQGHGLGAALYERFFETARQHDRQTIRAITAAGNVGSQNFHRRMGFAVSDPIVDYDGPGGDRVTFTRDLRTDVFRAS